MKSHFRFFLSHVKLAKTREKWSFLADFTAKNEPTSGRYL